MTTALESLEGATVVSKTVAANQSQNLAVNHDVALDDPTALAVGEPVTYTDTELGLQFTGKVVDVRKRYADGEGLIYQCADTIRTLAKTPAVIPGDNDIDTVVLRFVEGTLIKDAITAILDEVDTATLFPGGVDLSGIPDNALPLVDKTGQSVSTWLDDLLEATDGGVYSIDHTALGGPELVFFDFYAQPDLDLLIGNFDVVEPVSDDTPLLREGDAGHSLNNKYKNITAEGCGEYTRHVDVHLNAEIISYDQATNILLCKFVFPEKKVTGRFIDENGDCLDLILGKLRFGFDTGGGELPMRFDYPNIPVDTDETGQMFAFVGVRVSGVAGPAGLPPIVLNGQFTYTSYDGPFSRTKTSLDAALDNEGTKHEYHKEFFKYDGTAATGAVDIDQSAQLDAITDALFKRFSDAKDLTGTTTVHVKGLDPDVQLGSKITNSEFEDARVQSITYQYVERAMALQLSTVPIRDTIARLKQTIKDQTRERGGEFAPRIENVNCFCGGSVFTDEVGNSSVPRGGGGDVGGEDGGGGTSFDCVQGLCQERPDDAGQYQTFEDCDRAGCGLDADEEHVGAEFQNCVGCVGTGSMGSTYTTIAECEAANPGDPFANCEYVCDQTNGCQPVQVGDYADLAACESACEGGSGSGSGDPGSFDSTSGSFGDPVSEDDRFPLNCAEDGNTCSIGTSTATLKFVRELTVDKFGHVRVVSCDNCVIPIPSGVTSSISVCCDTCGSGAGTSRVLVFSNGLLVDAGTCA